MDALSSLLDGPRAASAFLLRSLLDPPWALRIEDEAPLTIMVLLEGAGWIILDDGRRLRVDAGDVGLIRGPDPYTVADAPATEPQIVIHPGQRCTTLDGRELHDEMALGVRTWGTSPDGATKMLTGTYELDAEVSRRLLSVLPQTVVLRAADFQTPLVDLLTQEMVKDLPGQEVILDRLLDLLVISALRAWFATPDADVPPWFSAYGDPVVGPALQHLSNNPGHPWTVAGLAAEVGVSRAGLAKRFTELVGEPPMTYLTSWRVALAADMLRDPDETVTSVARKVGYRTPYAFSTAFKRVQGVSPSHYRARMPA